MSSMFISTYNWTHVEDSLTVQTDKRKGSKRFSFCQLLVKRTDYKLKR